jgi:hypothetical protein
MQLAGEHVSLAIGFMMNKITPEENGNKMT